MLTTRALGTQGLTVSSIGLGLMGMSQAYGTAEERDERESIATIHRAIDLGVTFFDTAEVYGPFVNEELFARALGELKGARERIIIATKFGFKIEKGAQVGLDSRPEHVRQAVEGSLRRLRIDHIDLLYQHRVDPAVPIEDVVGAMAALVHEWKVRYLGLVPFAPLGRGFLAGDVKRAEEYAEGDFRRGDPRYQGENFDANMRAASAFGISRRTRVRPPGRSRSRGCCTRATTSWRSPAPSGGRISRRTCAPPMSRSRARSWPCSTRRSHPTR